MDKPEWIKRAEEEQKDLAGKIKRLSAMLADRLRMDAISTQDTEWMHEQMASMVVYNSKLTMRIQAHGGVTYTE